MSPGANVGEYVPAVVAEPGRRDGRPRLVTQPGNVQLGDHEEIGVIDFRGQVVDVGFFQLQFFAQQ